MLFSGHWNISPRSLSKKHPHQSSALEKCRPNLDLAGRSHTCTYTCSLTLVQTMHTKLICLQHKSTLQMLSSNWGPWESVQRKKNKPQIKWPSRQEHNVILRPSIGFDPTPSSSKVLPDRHSAHDKLCRAVLDLAYCVDGCHGCMELWSCDAFLCFIVPIACRTGTHTQPFLISILVRCTQTFMNFG